MKSSRPAVEAARPARDGDASREPHTRPTPSPFVGCHQLVDACRLPGCPVCRCLRDAARRHLGALLAEHVTDPETRGRLGAAWGFCATHAAALPDVGDAALGAAIVYEALVGRAREWLADATTALPDAGGGRGWRALLGRAGAKRVVPTRPRPGRCPTCVELIRAERGYLDTLETGIGEPPLDLAYESSDGLCLPHLELALRRPSVGRGGGRRLAARTLPKLDRLREELRGFIDKHDHRTRAAFTEGEAHAWTAALGLVAGRAELFGNDLARHGPEGRSAARSPAAPPP